jgi:hypothetical protein
VNTSKMKSTGNEELSASVSQTLRGHFVKVDKNWPGESQLLKDCKTGPLTIQDPPFRIIDHTPVYHISVNKCPFEHSEFNSRKVHRWGWYVQPCLILASEDIPGEITLYVDTRVEDHYALWTATRVDPVWGFGSGASYDLVAWTPKIKGDSIKRAGFRLAHAHFLHVRWTPMFGHLQG